MIRLIALLLVLGLPAPDQARTAEEHQARLEAWVDPLAAKLMALLPDPLDGLAEFSPWDYEFREPTNWGCPIGCTSLTQVVVQRKYVVDEPALVKEVEAAAAKALANAMSIGANPTNAKLQAAQRTLEGEEDRLKKSVRRLQVEIHINSDAPMRRGTESAPTRAGTIGGYPVTRFASNDPSYEPTPASVRLVVRVGPESFKNPRVKDNSEMRTEARSAVVSVIVQSRAATVAADEASARTILERIDLTALAKLLTP
jgi:hypothetical protein